MKDKLSDYRKKIDHLDEKLLEAFLKRITVVENIAEIKSENGLPVFDESREEEVINKKIENIDDKFLKKLTEELFYKIMDLSKDYQWMKKKKKISESKNLKIGYLGKEGSFSHIAAKDYFKENFFVSFDTFEKICVALKNKTLEYAVLPIENTSTGSILEVYDLLKKYKLKIVGEKNLAITHNLLAKKGATLDTINKVYSHPQAIKQCSEFLKEHSWQLINKKNTSASAYKVSKSEKLNVAAIGSLEASKIYDLEILKENINYNQKNMTRFIIVSSKEEKDILANKLTIGFSVNHEPGALYDVLGIFEKNNINLYKLESRPILECPFEYYFYVDLSGNLSSSSIKNVLKKVESKVNSLRVYGNYKRDDSVC